MEKPDINYTKEAFWQSWNLGFLAAGVGAMVGAFNFLPDALSFIGTAAMMGTVGLELLYLGWFPKDERFRKAIRVKKQAELAEKANTPQERLKALSPSGQKRYVYLNNIRTGIAQNYAKLSVASQPLLEGHLQKLDGLLDSYLNMLGAAERTALLRSNVTEQEITQNIAEIQLDMADDSERVKTVKAKRLVVLEKRLQEMKRMKENEQILVAQMDTIEDVVKYIHEQSFSVKDPEGISFQLDTLLHDVEETQKSVTEIEDIFRHSNSDLMADVDSYGDFTTTTDQQRIRE